MKRGFKTFLKEEDGMGVVEILSLIHIQMCIRDRDGDDTISLQEDELSVGKWAYADDLELEDDGISLTREMILKFKEEHAKR